jgi:hypothetical protein
MPKLPHLTFALSAALVLLGSQNAQNQSVNYPVVQNSDTTPHFAT